MEGGIGEVHEQHERGGGHCQGLLRPAVAMMDVHVPAGFSMLPKALLHCLICEAHIMGIDGHNVSSPLCIALQHAVNITRSRSLTQILIPKFWACMQSYTTWVPLCTVYQHIMKKDRHVSSIWCAVNGAVVQATKPCSVAAFHPVYSSLKGEVAV